MLMTFFISSSALGRVRADLRAQRIGAIVAKGGPRDAMQVLANGGAFALAAVGFTLHPHAGWLALGAGAMAAATADTWATEIGSLSRAAPRSILTGCRNLRGRNYRRDNRFHCGIQPHCCSLGTEPLAETALFRHCCRRNRRIAR
jgi:uncharacterized membrane protein